MSREHAKGRARPRQPETAHSHNENRQYAGYSPMIQRGVLPESGEFSLQCWAKDILDLDVQTVRKLFETSDIRYRRMGSIRFFAAVDVRSAFGVVTKETDPDYCRHGGKREPKPKE